MAATSSSSKVSLKLLIDKRSQKVLFAEAGKDFVDFLFTLLTLPIGTVIRLLNNKDMVGCLGKLYQSVSNLNDDYMQPNQEKDVVLKPKSSLSFASSQVPLLPAGEWCSTLPPPTTATYFYTCKSCTNSMFTPTYGSRCTSCGHMMYNIVTHYVPKTSATSVPTTGEGYGFVKGVVTYMVMDDLVIAPMSTISSVALLNRFNIKDVSEGYGFVKGVVTYMVMDDLVIAPMSTISSVALLNRFNIKDVSALEEKVVKLGMNEGLELLKHALGSKTVLTNVFLTTGTRKSARVRSELV
ncbi:hypothetical protein CTI12_AA376640 [Artemisia annua]|uniref:DUF674 domain-containing protein n=1 Tax=Artemisia annua TaxID=35608 RepID=A0A2U1MJ00_ARTAN|nr:hypothetical protein CTI12_AA376640 [Artemisia annua]